MAGTSFERIGSDDGTLYNNNVKSLAWREPGVLWAGTLSRITQITVRDDETISSTSFSPSVYAGFASELDDKRIYFIVTDPGKDIPSDAVVEVYLNGNRISYGYVVSLDNDEMPLVRFDTDP